MAIVLVAGLIAVLAAQAVVFLPLAPALRRGRESVRQAFVRVRVHARSLGARAVGLATAIWRTARRLGRRLATLVSTLPAALVVGGLLRLLWVVWATRTPTEFRDGAEYLRIATDFTHGHMPTFQNGDLSAFWAPGYPAILAPFVWLADITGWLSPAFAASLVNVVAATGSIALSAFLANRWIGPRTGVIAAWLVAICPALVFWTSTAHTESVFTAIFLGGLAVATSAVDRDRDRPLLWAVVGALAGAATLVHSPGVILLAAPVMVVAGRSLPWRAVLKPALLTLAGAAVLLVPWTVRNGIQVGIWTPTSTGNATVVCFGHHDDARPQFDDPTPRLLQDCYRRSPFDDKRLIPAFEAVGQPVPADQEFKGPDEPRWYRETMAEAIRWAATHPTEEVRLSALKVKEAWENEDRVVDGARNFAEPGWAGAWHRPLEILANLWLWIVGALAFLSVVRSPAARRSVPIWAPIVLFTLAIVGGVAYPHYRYPVVPLLAVLATDQLARLRGPAAQPSPDRRGE